MVKQSALKVPTGLSPEKQAKVDAILKKYEEQNRQIEREHAKEMAKLYGGAALQIGSAFIPGTLGLKLAGGTIKGLAPIVGRKIAQNVATGVTSGLASGAVEGLGRGLMENQNPLKTMATDSLAGGLLGGLGGYGLGKVAQKLNTQTAWHGSPYKFDKFSNEAIGTGEGAQAHGYGHYAAKNKDVAQGYAKSLSEGNKIIEYKGVPYKSVDEFKPDEYNYKLLADVKSDGLEATRRGLQEERQWALGKLEKTQDKGWWQDYLQEIDKKENLLNDLNPNLLSDITPDTGNLYKLSIPKDDVMLREDVFLSEQPKKYLDIYNEMATNNPQKYELLPYDKLMGRDLYFNLQKDLGSDVAATEFLQKRGVKGISYHGGMDGEARVIFNPDDIDIIPYYDNPTSFKEKFINLLNR